VILHVRHAETRDLFALPDIERSAGETFRNSAHPWVADHAPSPAEAYLDMAADGLVWVVAQETQLAGFVACEAFGDTLHVWELAVRQDCQGRGLGRALMGAAIEEADRRATRAVTLTTFRNVAWNAPFYERMGFRTIEPEDLDLRLAQTLANEAARGLSDRCAMVLDLRD
jgi:GNAT superfamily N-acetyltransferase